MEKICSLDAYKELIKWNKNRLSSVETNCFLMSSAMNAFIEQDRLYVEKYDNGLTIFIDEGTYYNLYYFWEHGADLPNLHKEKPVVVEELNNKGSRDEYLSAFEPILLKTGFKAFKNNLQVEANFDGQEDSIKAQLNERVEELKKQGLRLGFCTTDQCFEQVVALWDSALNITDIPKDHRVRTDDDTIVCVFNEDGLVCTTYWWKNTGKNSEARHVVTHPDYYRRGLAFTVLLAWCADGFEHGIKRYYTWISDTNVQSLALHNKAGFAVNGRTSKQFILQ